MLLVMTLWTGLTASAQTHKADDIIGTWLNQEATGKITLYKENGKYFGKSVRCTKRAMGFRKESQKATRED